jgi:hypothetical protein
MKPSSAAFSRRRRVFAQPLRPVRSELLLRTFSTASFSPQVFSHAPIVTVVATGCEDPSYASKHSDQLGSDFALSADFTLRQEFHATYRFYVSS